MPGRTYNPDSIGAFRYRTRRPEIYKAVNNDGKQPQDWQFAYQPLFLPEVDNQEQPAYTGTNLPGGMTRVLLPILLATSEADTFAFGQVRSLVGPVADQIQQARVAALQVKEIGGITIDDLPSNVPGAHIADTTISLSSGQDRFTLAIDVPSGQVDLLKQILPTLLIKYNLKYETQIGRKNVIAVTYDEVRQSNLYKNLQGFGSTAYVARDDLRKLSLDVRKVVNINATIEDPETFDQNIFKTVLDFLTTDALLKYDDPAAFDLMFGSTYNKEDLKPEKITSEIQDVFGERDSQNQWHKQSSSQVSGSASIVGIASADVDVNSSLDESAMQHLFEKHGLKVEWTGEKWVPKSLAIKQVNVAAMSASGTFTSAITYLSNDESAYPDSLRLVDVLSSTPPGRVQARVHVDTDIDGILILDIQNDANWWMSRNGDMLGLPNQRFALAPDGQVVTEYFEVDTKHLQLQAIVPGGLPGQGDGTPTGSNLDAYVSVPDGPGHTLKVHAIVRTRSAAAQQIVLTSSVDRRTASIPAGTIPVVGSPGSVLVNNTQPAREVSVDLEVAVGATTN